MEGGYKLECLSYSVAGLNLREWLLTLCVWEPKNFASQFHCIIDVYDRKTIHFSLCFQLADCGGMVLEEAPAKLAESFRLFLQGLGYGKLNMGRPYSLVLSLPYEWF